MKNKVIILLIISLIYLFFLWSLKYFFSYNSGPIIDDLFFKENISEYTKIVNVMIDNNIECDIYVNKQNIGCDKINLMKISEIESLGIFSIESFEKGTYILSIQNSSGNNSGTAYIYSEKGFLNSNFGKNWKKRIVE